MSIPERLGEVAKAIHNDKQSYATTVRDFLSWFDARRRGYLVVSNVREALEEVKLKTVPDFESAFFDGSINFQPLEEADESNQPTVTSTESGSTSVVSTPDSAITTQEVRVEKTEYADPVPRIGNLECASKLTSRIAPDAPLNEAITLLMLHNPFVLPVMPTDYAVNGYVNWATIGRAKALGRSQATVRDCMDKSVSILDFDVPLFDAIQIIAQKGFVLVRTTGKITGLVTANDISQQYVQLSEPFLIIGQIEGHLRRIIAKHFSMDQLKGIKDPSDQNRQVNSVADLTFGEYVRLLQNKENWARLNVELSRTVFIGELENIRSVRNEIMHFHPDPVDENDLIMLRRTSALLQLL